MNITVGNQNNFGKININGEEYDIYIAKSKEQKERGFQYFKELDSDKGMLFVNSSPEDCWYHMKNVPFPLQLLGLDDDMKVIQIHHGKPNDETPIPFKQVTYVLEINEGPEIKEGDELDFDDDETHKYVMKVLGPDGEAQMKLEGGERIISRKESKILIRKSLKAYNSKEDKDYKALGKYLFKVFKGQDSREPEYVKQPKTN